MSPSTGEGIAGIGAEEKTHKARQSAAAAHGDMDTMRRESETHARKQLAAVEGARRLEHILAAALNPGTLARMLTDILQRTRDAIEADVAHVLFVNEARDAVVVAGAHGYQHPVKGIKIPMGTGLAGRIMKSRQPMRTSNLRKLSGVHPIVEREGIVSYLGVPMFIDGEVSGVMVVGRRDARPFTAHDEQLLLLVADRVAASLDRERLLERSVRLQKRAEDLVRFKTDLLNMASHDLKTPLTAMLMQLQILQLGEPLDETRQKAVRILQRNTHRLRLMLDDMLDLARMESGTFVLRRVEIDVAHVVREACEIFGPKASNAGINFQENSEEGLIVKGDEHRLAQVLANLLSNAVRATSPGGQIRILAGSTGNKAEIVVEDSGCGMSKEQLARLFKPFERIGDYPSHRGTGLGLYLSRTVVEQHGGTITVSSPGLGKGTTLRVALPLDKQQKPEHRPPRTRPLGKPGVRGADGEREKPEALAHSNSEGPRRRRHQRTR